MIDDRIFHHSISSLQGLFGDISANSVDQLILQFIFDIYHEIRRGWSLCGFLFKYFPRVFYFGDISVVVLAPNIGVKIANVDPIVARMYKATMNKDRLKAVGNIT